MWQFQEYLLPLWCLFVSCCAAPDTLQFVHVLFRHGDRSPISTFAEDQYADSWPQGFGQLTQQGMLQEYGLGQWLRSRYGGFINNEYIRQQIYVRSTDYDRALMSAYSVVAGLFPPEESQVWKEDMLWQPIPVHSVPKDQDWFLLDPPCPVLADASDARVDMKRLAVEVELKEDLEVLRQNTGDNITSIFEAGYIYDSLLCMKANGKQWPSWATEEMYTHFMEKVISVRQRDWAGGELQRRLMGGVMVGQMQRDWKLQANNQTATPLRMMLFSAHDSTVVKLLAALDVFDWGQVHYSACVMVELHYSASRADSDGYYVEVWYRNNSVNEEPTLLTIQGCNSSCPLSRFHELMKPIVPVDRFRECHSFMKTDSFQTQLVMIVVGVILGSSLLALICGVVAHRKCRRPLRRSYGQMRGHAKTNEAVPMMLHSLEDDSEGEEEMS